MSNGELIAIFTAVISLVLAFLFLAGFLPRVNDVRPLAKIRIKSDDRYRRGSPPGDENEVVELPGLIIGLILVFLAATMIFSVLNRS